MHTVHSSNSENGDNRSDSDEYEINFERLHSLGVKLEDVQDEDSEDDFSSYASIKANFLNQSYHEKALELCY